MAHFYYPKVFGNVKGLIWDGFTSSVTHHSERFRQGANISVAGSDHFSYKHHQVDVYCLKINVKLQDVTAGNILSMEYLTLVNW